MSRQLRHSSCVACRFSTSKQALPYLGEVYRSSSTANRPPRHRSLHSSRTNNTKDETRPQDGSPAARDSKEPQSFAAKLFHRWIGSSRTESSKNTPSTAASSTSLDQVSILHKLEVPEVRSPSSERLQVQNLGITNLGKQKQDPSVLESPSARISRLASRRQRARAETPKEKASRKAKTGYGLRQSSEGEPIVSHMRSQMKDQARKRDEEREKIFATLKAALPESSKATAAGRKAVKVDHANLDELDGRVAGDIPDDVVQGMSSSPVSILAG
jgi:hypothetical protein